MATQTSYEPERVARIGEALYQNGIRPVVEAENRGRFLVLDIESGDYEIADDDLAATQGIARRKPNGLLYGVRIGYNAVYTFGGIALEDEE